jgi:GAF domain-containing protein
VIPLLRGDTVLGVLDLDSPRFARFSVEDQQALEALAALYVESTA